MISAIVLAAGQSTRMGQQKMLLPWGQTTVIGKIVSSILEAGVHDIHVVTGGSHNELENALKESKIDFIFNKDYSNGEMLTSIQVGLRSAGVEPEAALVVLGDQPQIESNIVQAIVDRYQSTHHTIIVPSYNMHRGHPWLIVKSYWKEIYDLMPPQTLRDFLNIHNEIIDYIKVDTPSVIQDLDTQNDYSAYKP
jgi:molybdenum cofactor cytidylyltransferase